MSSGNLGGHRTGEWVFGGEMKGHEVSVVATDGSVTHGPSPEHLGGFTIVDVPSYDVPLKWAAKIAVACRCAHEVRDLLPDGTV